MAMVTLPWLTCTPAPATNAMMEVMIAILRDNKGEMETEMEIRRLQLISRHFSSLSLLFGVFSFE